MQLQIPLNAEIVVLSACVTYDRRDAADEGAGFTGLTRSVMYAGARSLVVPHWNVESRAAQEVMVETFRNIEAEGMTEALRMAKLKFEDSRRLIVGRPKTKLCLAHSSSGSLCCGRGGRILKCRL